MFLEIIREPSAQIYPQLALPTHICPRASTMQGFEIFGWSKAARPRSVHHMKQYY